MVFFVPYKIATIFAAESISISVEIPSMHKNCTLVCHTEFTFDDEIETESDKN